MADDIVKPFLVKYDGRDANSNFLQADLFAESVLGAARFYNAVAHYTASGLEHVPKGNYKKTFLVYVEPPSAGSVDEMFRVLPAVAGEYAIYATLYNESISYCFSGVCAAIKGLWTRPSERQEVIARLASVIEKQSKALIKGNQNLVSVQTKLIETLPALAIAVRPHGKRFVAPIGPSCSSVVQFADSPEKIRIDEAEADVIRGDEEIEIDVMTSYRITRIKELNLETGHCIVDVDGVGEVTGKISDPVLKTPSNVYTSAMDTHDGCTVTAKGVRKDGVLVKLHISDAKP